MEGKNGYAKIRIVDSARGKQSYIRGKFYYIVILPVEGAGEGGLLGGGGGLLSGRHTSTV